MKTHTTILLLILATPVLRGDGCSPAVDDPGFELWCGESLCAWTVEAGAVARVPTWHPADFGVELVGNDARISQLLARRVDCLGVRTLADVGEGASLELAIDFYDDGTIDHRQPILGDAWALSSFAITPPERYEGARVMVLKAGTGRAVLAELAVSERGRSACTAAPVEVREGALGMSCARDSSCTSGFCEPGLALPEGRAPAKVCAACRETVECGSWRVCGLVTDTDRLPHKACVPRAADPLGAACATDEECASGVCCGGTCSTCCAGGPGCASGETCANGLAPADQLMSGMPDPAWRCDPGQRLRDSGEPCTDVSDCRSQTCTSTRALGFCWGNGRDCIEGDGCDVCVVTARPGVCQ